ncbi:MAG: UDP-3-O-(3-hydroxymyristoyl)glucosamine N-acyltransferase [Holosporaceae bacterium]|jgi:UDP-3-O-[3-hydroxymyristoyl] glucosamine N-acyltransferase|nr:UDP-3-O-(3-hydroxymyristoyl)glucosamine N-acyltransferase [Holosporaceae bacterium]
MIDECFFGKIKRITVAQLVDACGFRVVGDGDFQISGVAALKNAANSELSFFGNKKYLSDLKTTTAGAVIITENDVMNLPTSSIGLVCSNVMLGYAKALQVLYPEEKHSAHVCASAKIHETAQLGVGCYIGEHVVIRENAVIGNDVVVGHNSVIGRSCRIGDGGRIGNNVTIIHSIIGAYALINSGARIGESGFGIIPTGKEMVYVKQLGRVIIGDRVRIGVNTTVDRGSIEDTVIGDDTIIDNLVQIAHNVHIGNRSILVAQVGIAGSTKIGNDVVLAGQVGVSGHLEIGDGVIVAAKSGIASSIGAGKIVGGIPAVDIDIWKRQVAFLKMSVAGKKIKVIGRCKYQTMAKVIYSSMIAALKKLCYTLLRKEFSI